MLQTSDKPLASFHSAIPNRHMQWSIELKEKKTFGQNHTKIEMRIVSVMHQVASSCLFVLG